MEIEHYRDFLNYFISHTWDFIAIGLLVALFSEFGFQIFKATGLLFKYAVKSLRTLFVLKKTTPEKKKATQKLHKEFIKKIRNINRESLYYFMRRLIPMAAGIFLIESSFVITNLLLQYVSDGGVTFPYNVSETWKTGEGILAYLKYHANYTGITALTLVILAGDCLILSGGNKWLINTAKLLLTIMAFYIFFMGAIAAI